MSIIKIKTTKAPKSTKKTNFWVDVPLCRPDPRNPELEKLQVRKSSDGTIQLRGTATHRESQFLAILPERFRPTETVSTVVVGDFGERGLKPVVVQIAPSGGISVRIGLYDLYRNKLLINLTFIR